MDGNAAADPSDETAPRPGEGTPPMRMTCQEVWGGIRPVYSPIELPGVRGVLYSQPCRGGRGGDVHYLSICGSGITSRMCLADVAGHGEEVATVSEALHAQLRNSIDLPDQRRILRRLNLRLSRMGVHCMTTMVALTHFPPTRLVSVSYAGHEPGWLYNARQDAWSRLQPGERPGVHYDLPLGVEPRVRFTRLKCRVRPGDRVLLVTDGVLELPDYHGQPFGAAGVLAVLERNRREPCVSVAAALLAALTAHAGKNVFVHDDVTFLLVEFVKEIRGTGLLHALRNRLFPSRRPASKGDSRERL